MEGLRTKVGGATLVAAAFVIILLSMQGMQAVLNREQSPLLQGGGSEEGDPQQEGYNLLAVSASFVSSGGQGGQLDPTGRGTFRVPLISLPVSIFGYVGKAKVNLSLVAEGTTDGRGRVSFFLPQGAYIVNLRYPLFSSNVSLTLPATKSIVEMEWSVNRRQLRPVALSYSDRFSTGEILPGDRMDIHYRASDAKPPIVIEARRTGGGGIITRQIMSVVSTIQAENRFLVTVTPPEKMSLSLLDPQETADFLAYWVAVQVRTRPWR